MTERQEELAALEALHMLEAEESRVFAGEIKYAPKLVEFMGELQDTAGEIGLLVPPVEPPPECREKILSIIGHRPNEAQISRKRSRLRLLLGTVGWVAAIVFAVQILRTRHKNEAAASELAALQQERQTALTEAETLRKAKSQLEDQLKSVSGQNGSLNKELAKLKQTNALATLEVASLKAQNKAWEESVAVIVWDNAKQEGVLKMKKMHPAAANKDFQLWVVDKDKPDPVNAGVVKVTDQELNVYTFKTAVPISSASKFALSIETKGGVEKREGPIVMIGP